MSTPFWPVLATPLSICGTMYHAHSVAEQVLARVCVCVRAWQGRGAAAPKGGRFRESLGRFPAKFSKLDVISSFLPNLDALQLLCSGPRRHEK